MPEIQSLARYGQPTFEANLNLALLRADRIYKELENVQGSVLSHSSAIGRDYQLGANEYAAGGVTLGSSPVDLRSTMELERALMYSVRDTDLLSKLTGTMSFDRTRALRYFLDFLKHDDPNLTVNEVVDAKLARGFAFKARTLSNPIGTVIVPFKRDENNRIVPSVKTAEYESALDKLKNFMLTKSPNSALSADNTVVRIYSDHSKFRRDAAQISPDSGVTNTTMGINIPVYGTGGSQIVERPVEVRSSAIDLPPTDLGSMILLSDANIRKGTPDFGTVDDIVAETLIHEYAHSVHRTLGLRWGTDPKSDLEKAYAPAAAVSVSDYGDNAGIKEHFAETFAKFVITGEASDEFKQFLSDKVGLKDIDETSYEDYAPAIFRNREIARRFEEAVAKIPALNNRKFYLTHSGGRFNNSTPDQIAREYDLERGVRRTSDTISIAGSITDENNNLVVNILERNFTLRPDGSIYIYHAHLVVNDRYQGQGIGTDIIETSLELYRKIKEETGRKVQVGVYAHGPSGNGAYAWALKGYNWQDQEDFDKRDQAVRQLSSYYPLLKKYALAGSTSDFSASISELAAKYGISSLQAEKLQYLLQLIDQNGWQVNNELLNQIADILVMHTNNPSLVTPFKLASIGHRNKRTTDKTTSTLGRHIMQDIIRTWHGKIDI